MAQRRAIQETKDGFNALDLDEDEKYKEPIEEKNEESKEDPFPSTMHPIESTLITFNSTINTAHPTPPTDALQLQSHSQSVPPSNRLSLSFLRGTSSRVTASWSDLNHQSQRTCALISHLIDAFRDTSGEVQFCVLLLWSGAFCVFISLPTGLMIGIILMSIGALGAFNLLSERYESFSRDQGLISLVPDGILRDFLLNGSIVDIFYEIRHSQLGIPDFILSQVFPMDEADRQLIFEKLPPITRDVATTEGLLYLAPRPLQRLLLPQRLRTESDIGSLRSIDFSELDELSPINGPIPLVPAVDGDIDIDAGYATDDESDVSDGTRDSVRALHLNLNEAGQSQTDSRYIALRPRTVTFTGLIDENGNSNDRQNGAGSSTSDSINSLEDVTWIESAGRLFRDSILRRSRGVSSKPVLKAVVDTRIKEIALSIMRTVWKSPLSELSDKQLAVIFCCSVLVVLRWLRVSKAMRRRAAVGLKWMALMAVVGIGVMCFVELNIRRQSQWIMKLKEYIERLLFFHSEHHKAVQDRRRQNEEHSNAVLTSTTSVAMRRRDLNEAINEADRSSMFSRTLPNMGLWDRIRLRELRAAGNASQSQLMSRSPSDLSRSSSSERVSSERDCLPRIDSNDSLRRYKSAFL